MIFLKYLIAIVLLLVGECTVCVLAVFWPHLLGVDVRPTRLIRALQRNYAVPGREQFTAALDLAQTMVRNVYNVPFILIAPELFLNPSADVFLPFSPFTETRHELDKASCFDDSSLVLISCPVIPFPILALTTAIFNPFTM